MLLIRGMPDCQQAFMSTQIEKPNAFDWRQLSSEIKNNMPRTPALLRYCIQSGTVPTFVRITIRTICNIRCHPWGNSEAEI